MRPLSRQIRHRLIGLTPVHITYRLKGSLPIPVLHDLMAQREALFQQADQEIQRLPNAIFSVVSKQLADRVAEDFELLFDDALHRLSNGPYHLADRRLVEAVLESWQWIAKQYEVYIYAICVMSNHVHILLCGPDGKPAIDPAKMMKAHKGFTSRECRALLELRSPLFWEDNYFDRDIRTGTFNRVMWYILNNPVKAGLVTDWREWPGTWLNPELADSFR